ncbi:MAG: cyclopropane fatty acyl phospholipid synthase [Nitrospirae bacterium]|nr:cyclopropane fatty acyl phospholipid synthase [Nitrospirota bacterium]MBI3352972.1 cyclopropane fatty acyl phospholipid synthase [Nitrospirota bacterium]
MLNLSDHIAKSIIQKLADSADIRINGNRPWDIQVKDERCYKRILYHQSLGLGESYMDRWFECERLDEFIIHILRARIEKNIREGWRKPFFSFQEILVGLKSLTRAFRVGEAHYDMGNEFFEKMLDRRMTYTCGYWKNAKILDDAQEAKLELVCKKLGIQPGMKVLDIGCGWGSFARYAAERYDVEVVGITVSKEQADLAKQLCKGLSVEIRLQDYRDLKGSFDRVVSLGMFEHVCHLNYRSYMKVVHQNLKKHGLFLLHTIGNNGETAGIDSWISKYIFPNSMLPYITHIGRAIDGLFIMEDWHNFGSDYDKTLMAWHHNFEASKDLWIEKHGDRFYRMWKYFLLICAGTFRARELQLWQIVLSKDGVPGGYPSFR